MDQSSFFKTIPGEWAPQAALWTAWPSHAALWGTDLEAAREDVARLIAFAAEGQKVKVLAMGEDALRCAGDMVGGMAEILPAKFGDIWLRDTGPIFNRAGDALRFRHNGWGGKYDLPFDNEVGDDVAKLADAPIISHDFVLEGGAVEHNGDGVVLTTRCCLLNANRNAGWTEARAEAALRAAFNARSIFWLDEGLCNDHTDGHIDNVARFVSAEHVVCQTPFGPDDPNAALYEKTAHDLRVLGLEVSEVPSPGRVTDADGEVMPASHVNFVITNNYVLVPTYGTSAGEAAVDILAELFCNRQVVGLPSQALLTGGGSFHCITQQEPLV